MVSEKILLTLISVIIKVRLQARNFAILCRFIQLLIFFFQRISPSCETLTLTSFSPSYSSGNLLLKKTVTPPPPSLHKYRALVLTQL
jgi:hypothetical protein